MSKSVINLRIVQEFEKFKKNGGFCVVLAFQDSKSEDFSIDWQLANMSREAAIAYIELVKQNLLEHLRKVKKSG